MRRVFITFIIILLFNIVHPASIFCRDNDNSIELHNLNTGVDYYFSMDSFIEAGVSKGNIIKASKTGW
jgi:hypothetical protein